VTAPEQHAPPVYAVAAGAVLHAHAAGTLEPAVLLHTFLPPGVADALGAPDARVDVHGDGPAAGDGPGSVTVRVLAGGASLSWQLPVAPFVAALPGQPGDEGRMVLLAVVDDEPEPSFWARPADCEDLAAELQIPVADLVEALHGRLTPWLADDLAGLLHDDEHDRAVDRSPAQTLATAVLAHYRGDLDASSATTRLVRAIELAPDDYSVELGARLCAALVQALEVTTPAHREAVLQATGPFESEALRLLTELPAALASAAPADQAEVTMQLLLAGADREETLRAGVSTVARLAREGLGTGLPDDQVLQHLGMLDDAGLARLARLWVDLAAAVSSPGDDDARVERLAEAVHAEGVPGAAWLRATAVVLAGTAVELAGRRTDVVAAPVEAVRRLLDSEPAVDADVAAAGLHACLALGRYVRQRARVGPGRWLQAPVTSAVTATTAALLEGLDREVAVDLLDELLAEDVEGPDLLDGLVCATSQLLAEADPRGDAALREAQVAELLQSAQAGPRGERWLLVALLREAPEHDPGALDLTPWLPGDLGVDPDRAAARAGRTGMLRLGLACLEMLAQSFGEEAVMPRQDLLGVVLPTALVEHDLLRSPATTGPAA
jgi:hypothetical protein